MIQDGDGTLDVGEMNLALRQRRRGGGRRSTIQRFKDCMRDLEEN